MGELRGDDRLGLALVVALATVATPFTPVPLALIPAAAIAFWLGRGGGAEVEDLPPLYPHGWEDGRDAVGAHRPVVAGTGEWLFDTPADRLGIRNGAAARSQIRVDTQ